MHFIVGLMTLFLIFPMTVLAYSSTELAKKSQNPIENMVSVPLDSNFNFRYGEYNNTQYILNLKPVVPFGLNENWNLITRTILPIMHQPNENHSQGYITGIGDLNPSLFLSPANGSTVIWGAGPIFYFPTATNNQLGQGKDSIGPTFVVVAMPSNWVFGFLTSNVWSVAGQSNRPSVNQFQFQYFVNYNFPHGWYITTSPTMTADWMAESSSNRWTVPVGLGVGRVIKIDKQPINISIQAYKNVVTPNVGGYSWQGELNVTFLFPA